MSAIAGVWFFHDGSSAAEPLSRMLRALGMYGPDDTAYLNHGSFAMGRCLMRLLPEDRFDRQPLSSERVTALVADLRLDNRQELIGELQLANAAETADSDILLAAWRRWGKSCVDHLIGAFAFAVWNAPERELFLARDHVGERPLYYFSSPQCFAFASMPKGLHPLPFVGSEVDEEYIACYLAVATMPIEQTIFRRIVRLPSGCALTVRPQKVAVERYWKFEELSPLPPASDDDYIDELRERFDAAVRAHLRTTGKVGSQLSSGLDSSSVAATAARMLGAEGRELTAYTAVPRLGFQPAENDTHIEDEGPGAAEVAALYPNMRHVPVRSSETSFLDILDKSARLYDHPCFGPMNQVWGNAIMDRAQADGVTVLLNGNCGNSTLSYYGLPALNAWLRSGRWLKLMKAAYQIRREGDASLKTIVRFALWPSLPLWLRARTDPLLRDTSSDDCLLHPEIAGALDMKRRLLRDLSASLPGGRGQLTPLLKYGDVSDTKIAPQAGWKLDFRDPTYDRRVVEFCLRVPLEQFVRGGKLRSLARRAMSDRLPASTLARTKRGRQSADWYLGMSVLRNQMLAEVGRLEGSPLASRMLDLKRMRSLIGSWPSDGFHLEQVRLHYYVALTRGFSVGRFLLQHDPALQ